MAVGVYESGPNSGYLRLGVHQLYQAVDGPGRDDGVAVEEQDQVARGCSDRPIVRRRIAKVLPELDQTNCRPACTDEVDASVGRAVVDHDDLWKTLDAGGLEGPQTGVQIFSRVVANDDDDQLVHRLVNVGNPPALPGRPSVFDVSGSNVRNSPREPLKHHAGESSMNNYRSLNHTKWECQYHVVFIPKYRRKTLYGGLRHYLGDVLRRLAEQRESRVEEGHLLADHVHMLVSIPPQYSVAQVIGYIKGKSAIHIAREFAGRPGTSWGNTSGHGATTSRRSGRMNESCGNTSSSRNAKTGGWSNYGWRSSHL